MSCLIKTVSIHTAQMVRVEEHLINLFILKCTHNFKDQFTF